MIEFLYIGLLISLGFNLLLFLPAFLLKTDKLTDLSYSLSFIFISILLFLKSSQELSHLILLIMLNIWAIRLGGFLFIRINKTKTDKRFDGIRESFSKFLGFWLLQGISIWIIMLPSIILFSSEIKAFSGLYYLGIFIWLIGLTIESVADYQKSKFKSNPLNKDKWTNIGLWSRSRHPNYFGEMLVWIGIFIFCIINQNQLAILLGIISPLYIIILLRFISGVPKLEKQYEEKYGSNPEYLEYKKNTNLIILK